MSTVRKVLIIDDDDALRETLKEQFTLHDEFAITDAATASAGLKQLRSEMVDLVLLDVRLPDMDGREACKQMRKSGYRGPIVMLTAQDTEADTILGLDSGANDYIAKPFRFGVLLARIRGDNRKVRLTEKETNILKFLYRAGERVVGREILLHEVWGYNAGVTTHTLETHIYRLRQKIEADPSQAQILVTETGGYKLVP
jgi:DNA-binding response OmpR family regulator